MKTCELVETQNKKYPCMVFSTSYINPFDDIDSIIKEVKSGLLLFDLLLCVGDSYNRYIEIYFYGTKIDYESAKIVDKIEDEIKDLSARFYKDRVAQVENSVLTRPQQFRVIKGIL